MSKDSRYLSQLQDYYSDHGVFPPYSGIARLLGMRSKSSAAAFVSRMRDAGFLDAGADRRLRPGARFFERPARAAVRAGMPENAEETFIEPHSLDRYLVDIPSRTVLIQVKGESMRDAGILPGDLAVVELAVDAHDGDLVVARVDGEFTLKRLIRRDGRIVLRPANPSFPDIMADEALEIVGRVRGIVRRYT